MFFHQHHALPCPLSSLALWPVYCPDEVIFSDAPLWSTLRRWLCPPPFPRWGFLSPTIYPVSLVGGSVMWHSNCWIVASPAAVGICWTYNDCCFLCYLSMHGPYPAPLPKPTCSCSCGARAPPRQRCAVVLAPSCSPTWCWRDCCLSTQDSEARVWPSGWRLARSCESCSRETDGGGLESGAQLQHKKTLGSRAPRGTEAECGPRSSSGEPSSAGASGLSCASALHHASTSDRCLKQRICIVNYTFYPFWKSQCINKTENIITTVWAVPGVYIVRRCFDDELHGLDLILSTTVTPRHRAAVFSCFWWLDITLESKKKEKITLKQCIEMLFYIIPSMAHLIIDYVVYFLVLI